MVGSIALGLIALARPAPLPRGRDLTLTIGAGVLWFGGYNVALNAAEQLVDAGTAAMLVSVGPILIVMFAALFLGEGLPRRLLAGSVIAFTGAVVIGVATTNAAGVDMGWGVVLSLVAALAYAAGVTLEKPVLRTVPALTLTWLACSVGAVVTAPFAPQLVAELPQASAGTIAWLVYLGIFPTAVAFTMWAFALGRTTAGRLGSTTYLVAPLAVLLAWVLLAEVPPLLAIVGGIVSIVGVMVARSSRGR